MERIPETDKSTIKPSQRLYDIYMQVESTVLDDRGFGGPVSHVAEVDGWTMRVATSESGDLMFSATKADENIYKVFECGADGEWYPMTTGTKQEDFKEVLEKAERAQWRDELDR